MRGWRWICNVSHFSGELSEKFQNAPSRQKGKTLERQVIYFIHTHKNSFPFCQTFSFLRFFSLRSEHPDSHICFFFHRKKNIFSHFSDNLEFFPTQSALIRWVWSVWRIMSNFDGFIEARQVEKFF
jgi:hypothetical protein